VETVKVLFLTQTGELGPSSRYRVYQLLPWLQKLGVACETSPAINDALYRSRYLDSGARGSRRVAFQAAWRRRHDDLERVGDFDAVFVQKGVFPGLYSGFERKLAARKPLVLDFDDAIWLPRVGGSRLLRWWHREAAVQDTLRCAAAVIAGNNFLAEYAARFNSRVTVVPSSISVETYPKAVPSGVIGWIGSRTTLPYLKPLKTVFEALGTTPRVIAAGDPAQLGFKVEFRPWRLETELEELSQIGVGIAPLPDTAWEQGKCGVKLLQYMACGLPVVASPVGVHNTIVRHGENGFLASTEQQWVEYLHRLLDDAGLRERLGQAGRATVEEYFSVPTAAGKVAAILQELRK
jgi:glycosyltransferase involved in cell wall biosynthesis